MDAKNFIKLELTRLNESYGRALDVLTQAELAWRPAHGYNPIGLILLHTARSEDFFIQELARHGKQIWEKNGWHKKFNLPPEERVRHYTVEQVNAFVIPDLADTIKYFADVRKGSLEFLDELKESDFEKEITTPRGSTTMAGFFSNIVLHASEHLGEISYLRGLQRGQNK